MLTIVGWLWHTEKPRYTAAHVRTWARMIHAYTTIPHRFVLMTDRPDGDYGPLVEPFLLWDDWKTLKNPYWSPEKQHCYVRLKAFSKEVEPIFGKRFVSIDLDLIVLGDLDPLFTRTEDFLILRRRHRVPYNGSMWMMKTGCRDFVWRDFKGESSILAAKDYVGSDQAWLCHRLGPREKGWDTTDGVYGWTKLRHLGVFSEAPPKNARIVFFYGGQKPWNWNELEQRRLAAKGVPEKSITRIARSYAWIQEAWQ